MSKVRKTEVADEEVIDGAEILGPHQEALTGIKAEFDKITEAFTQEYTQLEEKYKKLRRPVFEKRASIFKKIPKIWSFIVGVFFVLC
jgi:hypothetical protein